MAQFVSDDVGLRKLARRAEAAVQLVEKAEVNVNLLVVGAVERSGGGFCSTAAGLRCVAEEHQLGMAIVGVSLLRQDLRPGVLGVVQNERHILHQRLFSGIAGRIRLADGRAGIHAGSAAEEAEQIGLENETENRQNDRPSDANVEPTDLESAATTTAFIAAVLNVTTFATWRPFHEIFS